MIRYRTHLIVLSFCIVLQTGCQTISSGEPKALNRSSSFDQSGSKKSELSKGWDSTTRFLTGREQINKDRAVDLYGQGDKIFREASAMPRAEARNRFFDAAKLFKRAADAHPGSYLEQDALFMLGECYFFSDHLPRAEDAYVKLQKEHPRNRHSGVASARLFSIAQYWLESENKEGGQMLPVNFVDRTRPYMDVEGHGRRVLDQMRYDDPTGKLADDTTMRLALAYLDNKQYLEADQAFTDLRAIYHDSEHLFNAHMLGIRCKMEMYAGAAYSGLVLDEADELVQRTRRVFPKESSLPENAEYLAKAAAEIEYHQAEKLWERAIYREKQGQYGGAKIYHQLLLERFPETDFAKQSREHLEANSSKPEQPPQRLAFLTKIFPAAKPQKPLVSPDGQILR